jgi:hypothetical protein
MAKCERLQAQVTKRAPVNYKALMSDDSKSQRSSALILACANFRCRSCDAGCC